MWLFVKNYLDFKNAIFEKKRLLKCDFSEKWDYENVIFCEKLAFGNAIFVKNGLLKCDFCEKCDF